MKRLLLLLFAAVLALVAVLLVNTFRLQPQAMTVEPYAPKLDEAALARRLGAAIAIPTISAGPDAEAGALAAQPPRADDAATQPPDGEPADPFLALHQLLEREYPRVHAALARETINGASLLYRWDGREACAPLLLLAHQDVVPVEPGTEGDWTHPPFSGEIADGHIWGRGAIDDKGSLIAILEAVERMLEDGVAPRCPVWLAFGHDEEVGGTRGARALAARLKERGVQPAFVLDEGGALTVGSIPGVSAPIATIGVAEKGYLSVRLRTRGEGGHSSMPPRATAIGVLATAVAKLEQQRPPASIGAVQRELLQRIAPQLPFARRVVLANLWLTSPLVEAMFADSPVSDATLRTTTAPTLFRAGVKDNVLPQQAEAVVNFRIRPGDSVDGVLAHVRDTVDDERVEIAPVDEFGSNPTAPAPWDGPGFVAIERALRQVSPEPDLIVAPYVTNGATDARHYAALSPNLYRFAPVKLMPDELAGFHGTDERVAIAEHARAVRFYLALLRDFGTDAR